MKLQSLNIRRNYNDEIIGKLEVTADHGEVTLKLSNEQCAQIMNLVAEDVVRAVREVSTAFSAEMVGNLLEHTTGGNDE